MEKLNRKSMRIRDLNFYNTRDLESTSLPVYTVKAHKEIINAIDGIGGLGIGGGAPEIVTASRDGRFVWALGTKSTSCCWQVNVPHELFYILEFVIVEVESDFLRFSKFFEVDMIPV